MGRPNRPVRVLELRSVRGTGGGPEKTILLGAAMADPARCRRSRSATSATRATRCSESTSAPRSAGVDYVEVTGAALVRPAVWPQLRRLVRERRSTSSTRTTTRPTCWRCCCRALDRRRGAVDRARLDRPRRERWLYYPPTSGVLARFPQADRRVERDRASELIRSRRRAGRASRRSSTASIIGSFDATRRASRERARRSASRPGEIVIGAVGRLEPQKRFDLLIEAFARSCGARSPERAW